MGKRVRQSGSGILAFVFLSVFCLSAYAQEVKKPAPASPKAETVESGKPAGEGALLGTMTLAQALSGEEGTGTLNVRIITMTEGIALVLKDSRLIKVSLPDQDMAYENSLVARSALLPHVSANFTQAFNQNQTIAKFGASEVPTAERIAYSYGFDVYQTLFDFGKSLSNYRASQEMVKATVAHIDSVKRVAILEFIMAYFNVLESEKGIAIAEKEVESLTSYLSDIQHLYEQGSAVKNDLLPAQVKLADARQKLIAAKSIREIALARMNNILALPLDENTEARDIVMELPDAPPAVEKAWEIAEKQRPELTFYDDQIKAARLSEKAKAVENLPSVYADAGYAYAKNKYFVHQGNAYVNLGAKMNVFDGGAAQAVLNEERARERKLVQEKDKLREDIKFEVQDSYVSLKDAREKFIVAKEALSQAEENVRFYRTKYEAGSATQTDVLEAISLQTRAQSNYYSSDYEVKRGYAKLMYSMGIDLTLIYETMEKKNDKHES